jgi:hypothetical protein
MPGGREDKINTETNKELERKNKQKNSSNPV